MSTEVELGDRGRRAETIARYCVYHAILCLPFLTHEIGNVWAILEEQADEKAANVLEDLARADGGDIGVDRAEVLDRIRACFFEEVSS